MRKPVNWAAVGLGAVFGLLAMAAAGLLGGAVLRLADWIYPAAGESGAWEAGAWAVQALPLLGGQLVGGYVGGRLGASSDPGWHGSLAALGLYAVFAALSLVSGSPAGPSTLLLFGAAAAAVGYGGGVLGGRGRRG